MKMVRWQMAIISFCILVVWTPQNIAASSHLSFDEDSILPELYPDWLKRLHNLQTKAASITNNFEMVSSMNMVEYSQLFEEFLSLFGRGYHNDATEYNKRFQIFLVRGFIIYSYF